MQVLLNITEKESPNFARKYYLIVIFEYW